MSGGITNFLNTTSATSATDLSGYFPAYEVLKTQIVMTANNPSQFNLTIQLLRNKNNVTNYIVLSQPVIISSNFSYDALSDLVSQAGIFNAQSTQFSATISIRTTNPALSVTADIYFVVVYPYTPIQPIINSLNYFDTTGNPINFFPQYMTSSISIPTTTNISLTIDLTLKDTNSVDYYCFGSFYNTSGSGLNATKLQQIFFYTVGQTNTLINIRLVNSENLSGNYVETLVLYPVIIPTNNYTSNYNVIIGNTNYNLSQLFPLCEFFEVLFSNDSSTISAEFTLTKNTPIPREYVVLTSFIYKSAGTDHTYNPWEGINSAGNILIHTVTSTSFTANFNKTTGQTWNGGIRCLVIYY
jgi:hypothetical protein